MKKYKLIKEYPGSPDLGTIAKNKKFQGMGMSEFWQELRPLFYTEDFEDGSFPDKIKEEIDDDVCNTCKWTEGGTRSPMSQFNMCEGSSCEETLENYNEDLETLGQPIYEGDKCWRVSSTSISYEKHIKTINESKDNTNWVEVKYFSNESNAKAYYNQLKWKNRLKFKVGDKILMTHPKGNWIFTVKNIDFLKESYIGDNEKYTGLHFIYQNDFQLYTEPKFITADGVKKYVGDEYYRVLNEVISKKLITDGFSSKIFKHRFDKLENAQQYLAEQLEKSKWKYPKIYSFRDISRDLDIYNLQDNNMYKGGNEKYTLEEMLTKFHCVESNDIEIYQVLKSKDEILSIGDRVRWDNKFGSVFESTIKRIFIDGDSLSDICFDLGTKYNSCHNEYVTKLEHKIITEEGTKLYGDDECYGVNSLTDREDFNLNFEYYHRNWTGKANSKNIKYFSELKNAQIYWHELQILKLKNQ